MGIKSVMIDMLVLLTRKHHMFWSFSDHMMFFYAELSTKTLQIPTIYSILTK